jgi:hypothetical protein
LWSSSSYNAGKLNIDEFFSTLFEYTISLPKALGYWEAKATLGKAKPEQH